MVDVGCGLKLKIRFADGSNSNYVRVLLIIKVDQEHKQIYALNVSSLVGKEHKLLMSSNLKINNYDPPFDYPSFVKLDEIYKIHLCDKLGSCLCRNGIKLDAKETANIITEFANYKKGNKVYLIDIDESEIKALNPKLA